MDNANGVVENYYKGKLFLFLPNVCDAECYFCYVNPAPSGKALLSKAILDRLAEFMRCISALGFEEVRLTGGEPLIFENIRVLIKCIENYNLDYTLLTNGRSLFEHRKLLLKHSPKKVTVSLHSLRNYEQVFGVENAVPDILRGVEVLSRTEATIAFSIVALPENRGEVTEVIRRCMKHGVDSFKIICANTKGLNSDALKLFRSEIKDVFSSNLKPQIRFTDLQQKACMLKNRGFLSVTLPKYEFFRCCTTVPYGESSTTDMFTIPKVLNLLEEIHAQNQQVHGFPCNSFIGSCPIALKNSRETVEKDG